MKRTPHTLRRILLLLFGALGLCNVSTILYFAYQSSTNPKELPLILLPLLLSVVLYLIILVVFMRFSKALTGSFHQLTSIMEHICTDNINVIEEAPSIDPNKQSCYELYQVATTFNKMMEEISVLSANSVDTYTKMYELEMNMKKAEIAFLRSQINPHFLYNTLTLICGMATENNYDGIIDITQALSRIYRYSIGNDLVTLRQEIDIIQSYIMIQMTRFEDRFTVDYDFSEEVYDASIPRMILQPLVENAVNHGIEKSLHKCNLTIGGRRNTMDNTLVLWIYDTGIGMPKERLEYIRQNLSNSLPNTTEDATRSTISQSNSSIGLFNVNSRIHLYYGQPYQLRIDSEENKGTNIQIKIPFSIL